MLEQPPEKSDLEIAAEIAAMSDRNVVRPTQALKLLQSIIWCSPLVVCIMIAIGFSILNMHFPFLGEEGITLLLFLTTCFISIYGIGCYDQIISHKTRSSLAYTRSGNMHLHALKFVAWQILFMPVLLLIFSLISIGIYAIIEALSKWHP